MLQKKNIDSSKKVKIIIGIIYISILSVFIYLLFSNFTYSEITSYQFILSNIDAIRNLKEENFLILFISFFFLVILWVLLLGFGSPLALLSGFVFGKWLGSIFIVLSLSIGATFLYILSRYFFYNLIKNIFMKKFISLVKKFKKNEFIYFLIYRFIGGIPFGVANVLPVLFNIGVKNYFIGTFIGLFPQLFVMVSLGSGIETILQKNNQLPSVIELMKSSEIYLPVLGFFILILMGLFVKKKFDKIN